MNIQTLIKKTIGTGNKHIPVLNNVCVQGGLARCTDMDIYLTFPVDRLERPDGSYIGALWDQGVQDKEKTIADHPGELKLGDYIGSFTVMVEDLATVAQGVSKEECRYYLCGVAVTENHIVATNGHIMFVKDIKGVKHPNFPMGAIMPTKFVNLVLDMFKKNLTVKIDVYMNGFAAELDGVRIASRNINGTYPDYTRVIPDTGRMKSVSFNPEPIRKVAKDWKAYNKAINGDKLMRVTLGADYATFRDCPIKASGCVAGDMQGTVDFDLAYISIMPSGKMYYSADSANLIGAGNGMRAVIMPLRAPK